jgi:hypothetical protein
MQNQPTRRQFVQTVAVGAAALALRGTAADEPTPAQTAIPRWRGFNLIDFFPALGDGERSAGMVSEDDLRWMRDWGFDYVRLPMDYWLWIDSDWRKTRSLTPDDVFRINEGFLERVDRAVDLCGRYGLHVCLNLHRAPGYCINNPEREPFVLWRDERAQEAFVLHWTTLAERYQGIASDRLSFNLVNEAPRPREGYMTRDAYCRIMTRATQAIRRFNPQRLVQIDGLSVGTEVVQEMIDTGVAQSVQAYWPDRLRLVESPRIVRHLGLRTRGYPVRRLARPSVGSTTVDDAARGVLAA